MIRLAKPPDAAAIAELVNHAYRGESGAQGWTTEAHLLTGLRTDRERVLELIDARESVVLLDVETGIAGGEKIGGCVHLERKNESTAYLGMLTTDYRSQAKGTGTRLLHAAEDFARGSWHVSKIEMTVISVRTELIAWYVKRGYTVTNEKRPFPTDPRFGIPLVQGLEFVVLEKILTDPETTRV